MLRTTSVDRRYRNEKAEPVPYAHAKGDSFGQTTYRFAAGDILTGKSTS